MTPDYSQPYLSGITFLCAIMAVFSLLRIKRRGASAYVMCGAFLALGASVYAYKVHAPILLVEAGGLAVVLLLAADVFLRAGQPPKKR